MAAPIGNKFAIGLLNSGRPPHFETPEELINKIQEYFDTCQPIVIGTETILNPPTVTGLALYLGFAQRKSLLDYKAKDEFCNIILRAVTCVENAYEQRLSGNSPTGAIFALKNMGWIDKQDISQSNTGQVSIRVTRDDDTRTDDKTTSPSSSSEIHPRE